MITEERIAEALDCFKQPGTLADQQKAALAVFLRAVDDVPVDDESETMSERLTVNEARLLASLVEGNASAKKEVADIRDHHERTTAAISEEHKAEIVQQRHLWQIERSMVLAWKKRVERLRRSLLRMAESPQYCDACGANALGPEPRLDEEIPF